MRLLRALRSLVAMMVCLLLLGVAAPLSLYLVVMPWMALRPAARNLGIDWVSMLARTLVSLMRLGGARFEFEGEIDGDQPSVVIMNHQSVLDIPPIIHIIRKRLPRFVIREKYTRGVPTVSPASRFVGCIPVEPKAERAAAVLALRRVAREGLGHPVLVYPEGHRSKDGEVLPFRPAGIVALLSERPLPVWIVVNDGLWKLRTLKDTFFALGAVRCRLKAIGPVLSPENPDDLPAFVEDRRQVLVRELAKMRAEATN